MNDYDDEFQPAREHVQDMRLFDAMTAIYGINRRTDFEDSLNVQSMMNRFFSVYESIVSERFPIRALRITDRSHYYLIGKLKEDPSIEATLCTGIVHGFTASLAPTPYCRPYVQIGLEYDGQDYSMDIYKASLRVGPQNFLQRLGWMKVKQPSLEQRYPFINRKYGAAVRMAGTRDNPYPSFDSCSDERLRIQNQGLLQKLKEIK